MTFLRRALYALAALAAVRLAGMALIPLNETTEARYGEIARLMLQKNDWVTLWETATLPFLAKPPLYAWLSAVFMKVLGVSAFAARLPHFIISALTVWLAGNYASTLTGNQVFAADTLHTGGNVNSNVGGDASGHIESQGDVNIAAKGDVSGTIGGNNVTLSGDDVNSTVTAANNASVNGNTVEGSYTGDNVSIVAADNVDAAVNATNFALVAPAGSVDGTWANYDVSGSGTVYLNGDPQIGVNPSQLVVEGFVLPAGTTIGPNGQLILPQGVLLGLLSPGGGKPKMILVHSVQELGQLLASGYSVIVIDLSTRGSNKPVQLASN